MWPSAPREHRGDSLSSRLLRGVGSLLWPLPSTGRASVGKSSKPVTVSPSTSSGWVQLAVFWTRYSNSRTACVLHLESLEDNSWSWKGNPHLDGESPGTCQSLRSSRRTGFAHGLKTGWTASRAGSDSHLRYFHLTTQRRFCDLRSQASGNSWTTFFAFH